MDWILEFFPMFNFNHHCRRSTVPSELFRSNLVKNSLHVVYDIKLLKYVIRPFILLISPSGWLVWGDFEANIRNNLFPKQPYYL